MGNQNVSWHQLREELREAGFRKQADRGPYEVWAHPLNHHAKFVAGAGPVGPKQVHTIRKTIVTAKGQAAAAPPAPTDPTPMAPEYVGDVMPEVGCVFLTGAAFRPRLPDRTRVVVQSMTPLAVSLPNGRVQVVTTWAAFLPPPPEAIAPTPAPTPAPVVRDVDEEPARPAEPVNPMEAAHAAKRAESQAISDQTVEAYRRMGPGAHRLIDVARTVDVDRHVFEQRLTRVRLGRLVRAGPLGSGLYATPEEAERLAAEQAAAPVVAPPASAVPARISVALGLDAPDLDQAVSRIEHLRSASRRACEALQPHVAAGPVDEMAAAAAKAIEDAAQDAKRLRTEASQPRAEVAAAVQALDEIGAPASSARHTSGLANRIRAMAANRADDVVLRNDAGATREELDACGAPQRPTLAGRVRALAEMRRKERAEHDDEMAKAARARGVGLVAGAVPGWDDARLAKLADKVDPAGLVAAALGRPPTREELLAAALVALEKRLGGGP